MNHIHRNAFPWDDVRIFLAVVRAASLRQAAVDLGVSRPTAGRRLSALEQHMGLKLFERRPDGLHATAEAMALVPAAEEVERAMLGMLRATQAADSELRGPVRVTLPAVASSDLLMPDFMAFCEQWPQIELIIQADYGLTDLAQMEADVAVRFMSYGVAPDAELAGRKVVTAYGAAYGYGDCWIGQRGAPHDAAWVRRSAFPDLPVRGQMWDGESQRSACASGMGIANLPCFFAEPLLTRRSVPKPMMDVWVLVHPDLRRNPRLRVFRDAIVDALKRHRPRLEGRTHCGPVDYVDGGPSEA